MSASGEQELDAVFHALSDSTRRLILDELAKRDDQALFEICVRIVEEYGISLSRQAISKHLAVLEASGLVTSRREGRTKLHTSNLSAHLPRILEWMNHHTE
ncbi:DNA-binding transcriptional repressor ArsR [Maioricimonas rarisocia]|uniref:DNA-binding transcriptional repressor ArsR n=1 Tax=Maioricimonas rarisocia TaxID=2528026 RepID=A0A517Z5J1_9PLAN|nr:metalloregulator ArsR/SmtB family transcription factor [Maioricimonas rarisocia]QDU37719.1 DNA-binding transcriptional repressor ArsR [Maioricimonas rarisocia]